MARFHLLTGAVLVGTVAACFAGSSDNDVAQNDLVAAASDRALARDIVNLLDSRCSACHEVSPASVRVWGDTMQTVEAECITRAGMTDMQRIDCLRSVPGD